MRFAVAEFASVPHGVPGRAGIETDARPSTGSGRGVLVAELALALHGVPGCAGIEANASALDRLGLRVYCLSTRTGCGLFRSPSLSRGKSIPEQWQKLHLPISSGCETENQ